MTSGRRPQLRALALALVLAGCSSVASERASVESDLARAQGGASAVLPGREWARCWFEDATTADVVDLVCQRSRAGDYPYSIGFLSVALRGVADPSFIGGTGSLGPMDEGVDAPRIHVRRDAFPVVLQADARVFPFRDPSEGAVVIDTHAPLLTRLRVDAPDATSERPLVIAQPFALWPIRIESELPAGYELRAETFAFDLTPGATTMHPPITSALTASIPPLVESRPSRTFHVPVPRDGELRVTTAARAEDGAPSASRVKVIDAPGAFRVDAEGLHRIE